MTQPSNANINAVADLKPGYTLGAADVALLQEMARHLLASEGQEPVAYAEKDEMLKRWLTYGRGMQSAGSDLPRHLIVDTEAVLAAPPAPVAHPIGITDKSEIERLKRGEMANVMPPDYKGVDAGDEVYLYAAPVAQPVQVPLVNILDTLLNGEEATGNKTDDDIYKDVSSLLEHALYLTERTKACRAAMLNAEPVSQPYKLPDDTKRMDWLVSKTVNVREPMVYGSHSLFWSQAITDENDEYHATKLREQIDAAMAEEQAAAPQ